MGDEGHRDDLRFENLAARGEADGGAGLGGSDRHIGHRDRRLEHRREAAAGDLADCIALGIDHHRALADRLAAEHGKADAADDRAAVQLADDARGAVEAAFGAAALGNGEAEIGGDRRGVGVEIMAV